MEYVCGFLFSEDKKYVALKECKVFSRWQGAYPAIKEQFKKETGILFTGWRLFAELAYVGSEIHCFYGIDGSIVEELGFVPVESLDGKDAWLASIALRDSGVSGGFTTEWPNGLLAPYM